MRDRLFIFVCTLVFLALAFSFSSAEVIDRIVATVNGQIILQSDWEDALRYEAFSSGHPLDHLTADERKAALDHLIDQELLREQLRSPDSQHASAEDVAQRVAEIRKQYPNGENETGWQALLQSYGLTEEDLKRRVAAQIDLMSSGRFPPASGGQHRQQEHRELLPAGTSAATPPVRRAERPAGGSVRKDQRASYPEEDHSNAHGVAAKSAGRKPDPLRVSDCCTRGPGTMSETGVKPARRKIWKFLLWWMLASLLLLVGLGWYSTTDSFRDLVRRRLVAMLEQMTGGRVELGSLHTVPFHFQMEVRDLTIHGREQPGEVPYAHVNSLMAQMKIWSILRADVGLDYVILDHPVIHIILYPDGSTNQPEPKVKQVSSKKPVEQLFALSISRLEVRHGELIWGDRIIPLDFAASGVSADMSYALFRRTYDGNILLGKADTALQNYRPFAWTAEAHFSLSRNRIDIRSLKATSGRTHLQAKGQVQDFSQPDLSRTKVEGDYDATVDLAEASAIVRRSEIRRGEVRLTGHGAWSTQRLFVDWKGFIVESGLA